MRKSRPLPAVKAATQSAAKSSPVTLASTVYDRLRTDILAGELKPGHRLRIEFLGRRYRTGHIPLREALNRLSSDGLVERRDQRGFLVAPVSAADLRELTKTRCLIEGAALRESIAARSAAWEEGIVLAFHRLSRTPRSASRTQYKANPAWEQLHRDFHRSLIAACGSRWLLNFCMQLADQSYRYRQLAFKQVFPLRNDTNGHRAIMQAAIDGNADKAVRLLQAHVRFTADTILKSDDALQLAPPEIKRRRRPQGAIAAPGTASRT
jgi:DNA-binding GntR family transcriptional regulator